MPRPGYRARLENGLKLDLNQLARRGFIHPGAATGPVGITWNSDYWGEIASGTITADMSGENGPNGWLRISLDSRPGPGVFDQRINLVAGPRRFGGRQWFFICPYLNRRCMVLWMPPGARDFACRQRWGRSVAYNSQFFDRDNRAHRGKAKINSRLCQIGGFDPDDWDLPPKPKWMRWSTYNRMVEKFGRYLNLGLCDLAAKLEGMGL